MKNNFCLNHLLNFLQALVKCSFRLKKIYCKHEFKGKEMQPRDAEGIVRWQCHKCKKVFAATYGLKILEKGKCIGEWS